VRILAFFCKQLRGSPCRANKLSALARMQFDCVDHGTNWDIRQRKIVPRADFHTWTRKQRIANFDPNGGNDVALLAVSIGQQCQAGSPVGIVFDRADFRGNVHLIPFEVDQADLPAFAAAAMAYSDTTSRVTPSAFLFQHNQTALGAGLGNFFERVAGFVPLTVRSWVYKS